MTKIEKVWLCDSWWRPITGKMIELIDAVNDLHTKQLTCINNWQLAKVYWMIADLGKQIKALQKIVVSSEIEQTSPVCAKDAPTNIESWTSAKNAQVEEDLLVPNEVEFCEFSFSYNYWEDKFKCLWLRVEKQVLYYNKFKWIREVTWWKWNNNKQCKLVPCNSKYLEAWDWFIEKKKDKSEAGSYYLYIWEWEHNSKWVFACADDWISVYSIFWYMDWYKVVPLE